MEELKLKLESALRKHAYTTEVPLQSGYINDSRELVEDVRPIFGMEYVEAGNSDDGAVQAQQPFEEVHREEGLVMAEGPQNNVQQVIHGGYEMGNTLPTSMPSSVGTEVFDNTQLEAKDKLLVEQSQQRVKSEQQMVPVKSTEHYFDNDGMELLSIE